MSKRYRFKYSFWREYGTAKHQWTLIGEHGGLTLNITDMGEDRTANIERFHGGLEVHHRTPPDYMKEQPPSHDHCWLLMCPCWHDGSSLVVSDVWIPRFRHDPHNHDGMFAYLSQAAWEIWGGDEEETT